MTEHGAMEVGTASGVEYEDHRRMYLAFVRMTKWAIIGVVLLLVLLALTTTY